MGERVEQKRRSLRCPACGAGNRLTQSALEMGWFRCAYCDDAAAVEGAGAYLLEGPDGAATRLVRPGSSVFVTDHDFVFSLPWGVGALVVAELTLGGALELAHRYEAFVAPWVLPTGLAVLAYGMGLVVLAHLTRQRLEVTRDRIDLAFSTLGIAWHPRTLATKRFRATVAPDGRSRVTLESPGEMHCVWMRGESAKAWLAREIAIAVEDARLPGTADPLPCPGCGGPVAEEKVLRDAGGAECPHCQTGLVQTEGGIALPGARVGHALNRPDDLATARPRKDGDTLEWTTPAWGRLHPWLVLFNLPLMLALSAGVVAFFVWATWATPVLKVLVGTIGLAISVGLLYAAGGSFLGWLFGRHRLRLSPTRLEIERFVGPFRVFHEGVPLARLLSLEAHRQIIQTDVDVRVDEGPNALLLLEAKTATRKLEIELYGMETAPTLRAVIAAVPGRLTTLGRRVERTGDLASSSR